MAAINDSSPAPSRAARAGRFSMRSVRRGSAHVIKLTGDLDGATASTVEEELLAVEHPDAERILLDLSRLSLIDRSGLRTIINAYARSKADGDRLRLLRGPPAGPADLRHHRHAGVHRASVTPAIAQWRRGCFGTRWPAPDRSAASATDTAARPGLSSTRLKARHHAMAVRPAAQPRLERTLGRRCRARMGKSGRLPGRRNVAGKGPFPAKSTSRTRRIARRRGPVSGGAPRWPCVKTTRFLRSRTEQGLVSGELGL